MPRDQPRMPAGFKTGGQWTRSQVPKRPRDPLKAHLTERQTDEFADDFNVTQKAVELDHDVTSSFITRILDIHTSRARELQSRASPSEQAVLRRIIAQLANAKKAAKGYNPILTNGQKRDLVDNLSPIRREAETLRRLQSAWRG